MSKLPHGCIRNRKLTNRSRLLKLSEEDIAEKEWKDYDPINMFQIRMEQLIRCVIKNIITRNQTNDIRSNIPGYIV